MFEHMLETYISKSKFMVMNDEKVTNGLLSS